MEDIDRITREDCVEFFATYYAPGNAAIYAVGDLEPEAALASIERAYASIPAGPAPRPVPQGEPLQRGERRAVVRYPSQAAAVLVGWRGPAATSADSAALDVLQTVLAVGEGSRLRRRLVETEELAVSVHVSWGWRIDPGVFLVFAELAPGSKERTVERVLWEEIAKVSEKEIGAAELRRAKRLLRSSVLHELATHNGIAHALGQAEALLGDWREAGRALEQYAAVGTRDVRRVAASWLDPGRRCVVTLEPEGAK
jgi:predicted Zn-dependent peptidase